RCGQIREHVDWHTPRDPAACSKEEDAQPDDERAVVEGPRDDAIDHRSTPSVNVTVAGSLRRQCRQPHEMRAARDDALAGLDPLDVHEAALACPADPHRPAFETLAAGLHEDDG